MSVTQVEQTNRINGLTGQVADAAVLPNNTRLDLDWMEHLVELYPEDLRERVIWLAAYMRDECGRSLDVLGGRAKKLGIEMDKTNWSKILRGRWNSDADGNPLPTPIVSQTKLLRAIDTLRHDARRRAQIGKPPFALTSVVQTQWDYINTKRAQDRVNKFGVIVGETGTSKSAAYEEYVARNPQGLVIHTEAPENGSLPELINQIAWQYGVALTYSNTNKRVRLFTMVNETRCIIIDNAQDLYVPKHGLHQAAFGFLRRLQDQTKCTIILSMTPWGEKTLFDQFLKGYFEQFEGRVGGRKSFLRLPEYPPAEDVLLIAEAFGLRDADRHLEYLVGISKERGRIRALFEALQAAKVLAERKKTALTIGHVKTCREED